MQPTKKESPVEGTKRFFRSVMAELRKVNWPTRKELTTYTIVVIVTVFIVSLIIFAWDLILENLFKAIGFYRY
jgi:preprotein translocase subunit SecE